MGIQLVTSLEPVKLFPCHHSYSMQRIRVIVTFIFHPDHILIVISILYHEKSVTHALGLLCNLCP